MMAYLVNILSKNVMLICVLGLYFLMRTGTYLLPLDRDEGEYAYFGWLWLSGQGTPYVSVINMKPPLIHFVYGITALLLDNTHTSIRIVSTLYTAGTFIIFFRLIKKYFSPLTTTAVTFCLAIYLNEFHIETASFNAEMLILLPLVAAISIIIEMEKTGYNFSKIFTTGLLLGVALLYKQVVVFQIIIFGVLFLHRKKTPYTIIWYFIGISLSLCLFSVYFIAIGAWDGFLYNMLVVARESTSDGFELTKFCYDRNLNAICVLNWLLRLNIVMYIPFWAAIGGFIAGWRNHSLRPIAMVGILTLIASMIAIKGAGWKDWRHYYILMVPGVFLGLALLAERLNNKKKYVVFLIILVTSLPLLIYTQLSMMYWDRFQHGRAEIWPTNIIYEDALLVSKWVKGNIPSSETMLVWNDESQIYFYTERKAPTIYEYYYLFEIPSFNKQKEEWWKWLNTTQPKWVLTHDGWNWTETINMQKTFFSQNSHYRLHIEIGKFNVYRKS